MYIFIAADGQLTLRDSDNMNAFSIVEEIGGSADKWLAAIGLPVATTLLAGCGRRCRTLG